MSAGKYSKGGKKLGEAIAASPEMAAPVEKTRDEEVVSKLAKGASETKHSLGENGDASYSAEKKKRKRKKDKLVKITSHG